MVNIRLFPQGGSTALVKCKCRSRQSIQTDVNISVYFNIDLYLGRSQERAAQGGVSKRCKCRGGGGALQRGGGAVADRGGG